MKEELLQRLNNYKKLHTTFHSEFTWTDELLVKFIEDELEREHDRILSAFCTLVFICDGSLTLQDFLTADDWVVVRRIVRGAKI